MRVLPYNPAMASEWDSFVRKSKNGTFLFCRNFMDYHSKRFVDSSLVFMDKKNRICGLFPANVKDSTIYSHEGLTYGGFILDEKSVQSSVNEMFALALDFYRKEYLSETLVYKPVPHIYHKLPAEEDLYVLFRAGANLVQRSVSSSLYPRNHPKQRQSRRGGVVKALKNGVEIEEISDADSKELKEFHDILAFVLKERHKATPVHSYEEMRLLMKRFPKEIMLYVAKRQGEVVAGSWVFITPVAVHTQYLAASDMGKATGAEDLLIDWLISTRFRESVFFDFGISTEKGGRVLNQGLIFEKEGFGARSVCYDVYELNICDAQNKIKGLV